MTTPAHSPDSSRGGESEAPQAGGAVDKRSRKVYVLWGIALAFLLAAGLFCWLVVVPVWKVNRAMSGGVTKSETIARLGGPQEAVGYFAVYVRMPDWVTDSLSKRNVVITMRSCGTPAVPLLVECLHHSDEDVQTHAWAVLMQMCSMYPEDRKAIAKEVARALDTEAAEMAAYTLSQAGPEGKAVLIKGLGAPSATTRRASAQGLKAMGGEAREAIAALESLSCDPDSSVRQAAAEALQKIKQAGESK